MNNPVRQHFIPVSFWKYYLKNSNMTINDEISVFNKISLKKFCNSINNTNVEKNRYNNHSQTSPFSDELYDPYKMEKIYSKLEGNISNLKKENETEKCLLYYVLLIYKNKDNIQKLYSPLIKIMENKFGNIEEYHTNFNENLNWVGKTTTLEINSNFKSLKIIDYSDKKYLPPLILSDTPSLLCKINLNGQTIEFIYLPIGERKLYFAIKQSDWDKKMQK